MDLLTLRNSGRVAKAINLDIPQYGECDIYISVDQFGFNVVAYVPDFADLAIDFSKERWQITAYKSEANFEPFDELALKGFKHKENPRYEVDIFMANNEYILCQDLQEIPQKKHREYIETFNNQILGLLNVIADRASFEEVQKSESAQKHNAKIEAKSEEVVVSINQWRKIFMEAAIR